MVDQGILNLDQPLYTYLPYSDIAHDDRYKLITARMILCHTSGFPNWRFLNADKKLDIKFTPGTQYLYSGEGFEYLANVIAYLKNIQKNDLHRSLRPKKICQANCLQQRHPARIVLRSLALAGPGARRPTGQSPVSGGSAFYRTG